VNWKEQSSECVLRQTKRMKIFSKFIHLHQPWTPARGEGRGVDSHTPYTGCSSYLLGVKNDVLVALRVFSLERSTVGDFAVPFRVMSWKIWQEIMCYIRIGTSQGRKKISNHTHITGSWYLLGVLFKISNEHLSLLHVGVPPPPPPGLELCRAPMAGGWRGWRKCPYFKRG